MSAPASSARVAEPAPVLPPVRGIFRAAVQSCAPRAHGFGPRQWEAAEALVEDALALRPPEVREQIVTFLRVLNLLPVLRYGRRFPSLAPERRLAVLRWLERAPVLLLRRGTWGVRTLSYLAVYGQDGVRREIGYRADPRGWAVRPDAGTAATAERADARPGQASGPARGPGPGSAGPDAPEAGA